MFRKFKPIEQFRHIVKEVKYKANPNMSENKDEPISVYPKLLPIIEFTGTVKLHGTNGCVGYKDNELFVQSRNNIITPENDNAGFARWVDDRKEEWITFFKTLESDGFISEGSIIYVYGEFAGSNIQKGVGISNIKKSFFIFDIVEVTDSSNLKGTYKNIDVKLTNLPKDTYNIYDFKTFKINIDFNNPDAIKNKLVELTEEVEKDCPVSRALLPDFDGELIGEGIVWRSNSPYEYMFKTKGEKHSKSKVKSVKKLSPEELEKLDKVDKCAEEIFSVQRCNQALTEIFGVDFENVIDMKKIGEYLKWVMNDTLKEEYDIIEKYGLTFKDVSKKVSNKAKQYFIAVYKK